ncbi:hypothetical protein [Numidum massiliense]|uniref:hypothetical protein n=1 Tax=Numidum massiliense TaxID=1522315 RepID=UPI0006D54453|nr:hypothetical protein [Numidum massiliense]
MFSFQKEVLVANDEVKDPVMDVTRFTYRSIDKGAASRAAPLLPANVVIGGLKVQQRYDK